MSLSEAMIPVYANLIRAGLREIEQVPVNIRDQVRQVVEAGENMEA